MDALKMIAADSIKENRPQFEIGDTVRVHVNIREGERERESRCSKEPSLPREAAAFPKPLP